MDGDKELIEKIGRILNGCSCSICILNADKVIALVREHDGRLWLQAIRKSMLENHFGTKCTLDTIADVRKRLDAIPQSAEPPAQYDTSALYMQRVGHSRCVRCDYETSDSMSFAEQDAAMHKHLDSEHPGWLLDGSGKNKGQCSMSELKTAKDLQELYEDCMADDSRASRTTTSGSMIELIERIDAAESRVKQLERKLLSCVFCGFVGSDVEQLKAHSAMCEKHPIAALKSENERLEKRIEGLIDKYEGCPHTVDCGCAQDKPSDICAHHAPQLRKALAENERLEKQIARFLEPKGENDGN